MKRRVISSFVAIILAMGLILSSTVTASADTGVEFIGIPPVFDIGNGVYVTINAESSYGFLEHRTYEYGVEVYSTNITLALQFSGVARASGIQSFALSCPGMQPDTSLDGVWPSFGVKKGVVVNEDGYCYLHLTSDSLIDTIQLSQLFLVKSKFTKGYTVKLPYNEKFAKNYFFSVYCDSVVPSNAAVKFPNTQYFFNNVLPYSEQRVQPAINDPSWCTFIVLKNTNVRLKAFGYSGVIAAANAGEIKVVFRMNGNKDYVAFMPLWKGVTDTYGYTPPFKITKNTTVKIISAEYMKL